MGGRNVSATRPAPKSTSQFVAQTAKPTRELTISLLRLINLCQPDVDTNLNIIQPFAPCCEQELMLARGCCVRATATDRAGALWRLLEPGAMRRPRGGFCNILEQPLATLKC